MPKQSQKPMPWNQTTTLLMAIFLLLLAMFIYLMFMREGQTAKLLLDAQLMGQRLLKQTPVKSLKK